jgi:hypothetical protein
MSIADYMGSILGLEEDHNWWDKLGLKKKLSRNNCPAIHSLKQRF